MIDVTQLRRGNVIEVDNVPYTVVENEFVKPGKGNPFNRIKLKHLLHGNTTERTFKVSEKVVSADVLSRGMNYLYNDGENFHFMDPESYEQVEIPADTLGATKNYLLEQMNCQILFYNGKAVSVTAPNFVTLEIIYTEPGLKGDTTNMPFKTAKLETEFEMQVPLFCEIGDKVKIDTREDKYIERIKK